MLNHHLQKLKNQVEGLAWIIRSPKIFQVTYKDLRHLLSILQVLHMAHRSFHHILWVVVRIAGNGVFLEMIMPGSPIDFVNQWAGFPIGWHLLFASLLLGYHHLNFHFNCRNKQIFIKTKPEVLLPWWLSLLPWTSKGADRCHQNWHFLSACLGKNIWQQTWLDYLCPLFYCSFSTVHLCIHKVNILASRHYSLVQNNPSITVPVLFNAK